MTSTLDHRKSAPLPLGGSSVYEDDVESLGSSVPEDIDLKVILPDGTEKVTTVSSSKQMLDLAVWLSASNRLSPANHTLAVFHPDTGRPLDYKASQMIGALHVDTVHLVNKKANKDKTKRHTVAQPFEMTNRLTVNLPKNQKTVIRISPLATLADIFKVVCKEKGLDPYKHELRHPTQPDIALNMASPLNSYNITEITVVNLAAPDQPQGQARTGTVTSSIYDTHWTYNSMPRNKSGSSVGPPGGSGDQQQQQQQAFMPGITEKKKKKGIMSLFSRKKEGKFKLSETTYTAPSTSAPPPRHEAPVSNGSKPQAEVKPQPQQSRIVPETSTVDVKSATLPSKPHRKKRQAPAPPGGTVGATKPLSVNTDNMSNSTHTIHSRGSSHSSGFDETNMSPLESPGSSSGKSGSNHGTATRPRSEVISNGQISEATIVEEVHSSMTSSVSRQSSMSTGGNSSTSSLTRGKKKRRAPPPPPQGGSKPPSSASSPSHSLTSWSDGSRSGVTSANQSPAHVTGTTTTVTVETREDDQDPDHVAKELQMAIAEELKKEVPTVPTITQSDSPGSSTSTATIRPPIDRPCNFVAPPPPDTPPPPETPDRHHDLPRFDLYNCQRSKVEVVDISTQVHVTLRDSLCSEVSSCDSCISETPTEVSHDLDTDTTEVKETSTVHREPLERQKSDVAVFVEQMAELTDNVKRESESESASKDVLQDGDNRNQVNKDETDHFDVFLESNDFHSGHVSVVNVFGDEQPGSGAETVTFNELTATDTSVAAQQPTQETYKKAQPYFSDSSSDVESLSNYNLDEVATDSDEAVNNTNRSSAQSTEQQMGMAKKKIVPEFTLEFGEDDVLCEDHIDNTATAQRDSKSSELAATLTAFDVIEEADEENLTLDNDAKGEPHYGHANSRVRVNLNERHFEEPDEGNDSGRESPLHADKDSPESLACGEEISFDNQEVVYVSPHSGQGESNVDQVTPSPEPDDEEEVVTYSEWTETYTVSRSDPRLTDFSEAEFVVPQPESNISVQTILPSPPSEPDKAVEKVSPPSGSSLYSIITGVKSKTKTKDTTTGEPIRSNTSIYSEENEIEIPVEDKTIMNDTRTLEPIRSNASVHTQEKEEEKPVEDKPTYTSLRDAYKKQPTPVKEPETIIIPKPVPYRIPPVGPRQREPEFPKDPSDVTRKNAIKEARRPSGDSNIQTEEPQALPIVYKTASLAVSRKAPKVSKQDNDEKQEPDVNGGGTRFWGPRPWSARSADELLAASRQALSDQGSHKEPLEVKHEKRTPQKGRPNSTIGMYSPGKSSNVESSPKDKCTEISFSPKSEEEESHNVMEEKSISMLAYPVEKKSVLKSPNGNDTRQYNSSVNLSSVDSRHEVEKTHISDRRMYNSTTGLSELGVTEGTVFQENSTKPIIRNTGGAAVEHVADTTEKAKRTLEEQYSDLHKQYAVWQKQLVDNQALLAKKKLINSQKTTQMEGDPPPPEGDPPPPDRELILRKQMSVDAVENRRALENYRKLNTPRPFEQKYEQSFQPKPIIKKRLSLNDRKRSTESQDSPDESKSKEVQHPLNINTSTSNSVDPLHFNRSTSVDSDHIVEPDTPDIVVHRTLTTSKSGPPKLIPEPPPLQQGGTSDKKTPNTSQKARFQPKLDPREELMIAIRSAGGRKSLKKPSSVDADW